MSSLPSQANLSQANLSEDLGSKKSIPTKKVVKKVIKKKSSSKNEDEVVEGSQNLLNSKANLTDSNIINYKNGQVSTMTSDDIEKILGDKERLLGELYTAELEIDRLEEENQVLKNTIEEQKQTISKLLITNNENGARIGSTAQLAGENVRGSDNNVTIISLNNEDIDKDKLLKKIEALEVANEHLKGQNEELLGVIQSSEEEIERLETELRNVKSSSKIELTKTKIENNKLKSSIEDLENKVESIASMEKENEELKNSIEALEQKNASLAEMERENNELRSSLENFEDKDQIINNLQTDNQELKISLENIQDEITKINQKDKEIELLQRENDILRRENEELVMANNELQATINELTANMKQINEAVIPTDVSQNNSNMRYESQQASLGNENGSGAIFECEPEPNTNAADNNSHISGSNKSKNLSICSSSVSLLKCSVPELVKEIKDLKKCVYYINKQKKDLEKKLQEATNNQTGNKPPVNENGQCENCVDDNKEKVNCSQNIATNETFTLQELQGIIEGMDKEIMNTRRIKAQFDEQENSIIDLKRELLKYSKNKEERVKNIGRVLNADFGNSKNNNDNNNSNNNNINIDSNNSKTKNENNNIKEEEANNMDNIYFKVQLQNDKTKLQNQLSHAKKTIHQLKKLCDGLSSELENYRNNSANNRDNTTFSLDIKEGKSAKKHSHSRNRTYDKRSVSLGRNLTSNNMTSNPNNNMNYYISINDNVSSTANNSHGTSSISDSASSKNNNNTYDTASYYSNHGYGDNNSLISGSLITSSSLPKEKASRHNHRSRSTNRKYYDNTTDIMMLINERDKEREHRLNRDLNSLQNKFQDLLKSYQSIKNESDVISNEIIGNPSPISNKQERHRHSHSHSRHRKQSDLLDLTSTRGRSPTKRKHCDKDDSSNGHLRSCSTHTNGIKVEVFT